MSDELSPQADAQHRQVGFVGGFEQGQLVVHPGVVAGLVDIHRPAHRDHPVDAAQARGHRRALVQLHDLELVTVVVEDAPQPGGGFERVMFEDEDGHEGEVTAPQRYTFGG